MGLDSIKQQFNAIMEIARNIEKEIRQYPVKPGNKRSELLTMMQDVKDSTYSAQLVVDRLEKED